MADAQVNEAQGVFTGTVGTTDLSAGDLVYSGTNWQPADASDNTKYAEAFATNNFSAGEGGSFATSGIIVDIDAPYTQGDQYYLSETAGAITATRPTTAASLRQLCGFGISTSELRIDIRMVSEQQASYNGTSAVAAESGVQLDSGNYVAAHTNGDGELMGVPFAVPQNAVGVEFARSCSAAEVVSGATDYTLTVSGATDGEQWNATTADSTLTDVAASGAVADEIQGTTVTTGLDAAGVIEPDNVIGYLMTHDGGQTDITLFLALEIVWLVV